MSTPCRMYANRFPEVDDVVMVQVKSIAEMGAYVSLLEYNNIEGMILLSELSRRRIRSINKLIKVGRQEPVMVLRVDTEKGYIDLSKRRVAPEDVQLCEERYNKSKLVHSIMNHVAVTTHFDLEELYSKLGWPLYKKYGHAYDAFRLMVHDLDSVMESIEEKDDEGNSIPCVPPQVLEALMKNISRRMTPQPLKMRADVEMTCFEYDGVLHIKEAMKAAAKASEEDCEVKMQLVATPLYVLTTMSLDKDKGLRALGVAVKNVQQVIESHKGKLVVKEAPRAVSEREDRLLADKMAALEAASTEKDGDQDTDEDDETMGNADIEGRVGLEV